MKTGLAPAVALAFAPLMLVACDTADTAVEEPIQDDVIDGIAVSNARLVLPAVAGNPAAVYFDIANMGEEARAFRSGEVTGAGRTEFHESVEVDGAMVMGKANPQTIQPGETLSFKPGSFHLMAFDLGEDFSVGGDAGIALIAAGGRRHVFTARIQSAGDAR